jgi:hypothetical protein
MATGTISETPGDSKIISVAVKRLKFCNLEHETETAHRKGVAAVKSKQDA